MKKTKQIDMNSPLDMIINMFEMLPKEDAAKALNEFKIIMYNKQLSASNFGELVYNEETNAQNYTEVVCCTGCQSNNICKNGKDRNGAQRYICKQCGRTFTASSYTLSSNTLQSPGKWMQFIVGLLNCESCEVLSEKCGISTVTAHSWRLKVFLALEELAKDIKLSGAICADDTRIPYNFKGNHGIEFLPPRRAHKRGHQNTIKNVQKNTICVICAIDSLGHSFSCYVGFGNPSGQRLSNGFKDKLKIENHSVLITDGAQCFKKVVDDYQIPRWERKITVVHKGKRYPNVHGNFHIQKINNYHSKLKRFLARFNSVSSRYLPGYLLLFDFIENNANLSDDEKAKKILEKMVEIRSDITQEKLKYKYILPISNGPEQELWETKITKFEQAIYRDWYNKKPIKEICKKHKINRRKIYSIKEKVDKYNLHEKVMTSRPGRPRSVSDRDMEIFVKCHHEGQSYASVATEYGLAARRIGKIVNRVRKFPEASLIPKYSKPKKEKVKKTTDKDKVYADFKLIKSSDIKYEDAYKILAPMHNKAPQTIKQIVLKKRSQDENAKFVYRCSEERKILSYEEYYEFLETRDLQIYNEVVEYKKQNPSVYLVDIFKIIAPKHKISVDRTTKIYYKVRKSLFPPDPNEAKISWAQNKDTIYKLIAEVLYENTDCTKTTAIKTVANKLNLAPQTVCLYYYDYLNFMQQEHNQVPEPIVGAD